MFIIICNSGLHQIQFDIYATFKLHGVMTGSVGSKGKHVKYVSGGGGLLNCVLYLGAENYFCDRDFSKVYLYKLRVKCIYREPTLMLPSRWILILQPKIGLVIFFSAIYKLNVAFVLKP